MKNSINYLFLILFLIATTSCTNENINTLSYPDNSVNLDNVTYTNTIKTFIDNNCISCHGTVNPTAGLDISTYTKAKNNINAILGRIDLQTGQNGIMPPSGRMPENTIQAFKNWLTQGLTE